MLTNEQIRDNRKHIIELLESTKRKDIQKVIDFIDKSGYFYAWGSQRHHCYKGGLAQHSLEVYKEASNSNTACTEDSVIICSLLHDLCKGVYLDKDCEKISGHGSKSVHIITDVINFKLKPEEWRAIRFHMMSRSMTHSTEEEFEFRIAKEESLCRLIHESDCISIGRYEGSSKSLAKCFMRLFNL